MPSTRNREHFALLPSPLRTHDSRLSIRMQGLYPYFLMEQFATSESVLHLEKTRAAHCHLAGNVELSLLPFLFNFICKKGFGINFSSFQHSLVAPCHWKLLPIQVFMKNKHTSISSIFCKDKINKNFAHRSNNKQEPLTAWMIRLFTCTQLFVEAEES